MSSDFAAIREEFDEEVDAIKAIINTFSDPTGGGPKTRVAAVNAVTLLLSATFEEFVREMARAYARAVVNASATFDRLPKTLVTAAWRRSMEGLSRLRVSSRDNDSGRDDILSDAASKFAALLSFYRGDLTQEIYRDLIHNENNMRPDQINNMFKISDCRNICLKICDRASLLDYFEESDPGKAHDLLRDRLDAFIERRNQIAHSIALMRSSSPDLILQDIDMLGSFGRALCETLELATST